MSNRLSKSSSPYLLQHAGQPVHWQEWGEDPFDEAKRRDCPVLLSIGYSTCHWCHVMAHESFEDEEVAQIMNRHFVPIKVDREEYPELDRAAMQVCQMIHGHGGWPLNLVLTPDKRPFFAVTYLPKKGRLGQPGWIETLNSLNRYWTEDRERVQRTAETIESGYHTLSNPEPADRPTPDQLEQTVNRWLSTFDSTHGGFGQAPKFPTGHALLYLLDRDAPGKKRGEQMAHFTIQQILRGGITDALGGGIHRYSTDREWRVPHFEKMLYDQAIWLLTVSEAYRQFPVPIYLQNLNRTVGYLLSHLRSPDGGFYCGEDADSEGEEGTFYLWKTGALEISFNNEEQQAIRETYQIRTEGNVTLEGARQPDGRNVLYRKPLPSFDPDTPLPETPFPEFSWETRLLEIRNRRPRPGRDEKILTDWNGLLIAGLSRAGSVAERPDWIGQAVETARFLTRNLLNERQEWVHRYRDGVRGIASTSNDYAALVWGWLELYRATFDPHWLREGIQWASDWATDFTDPESGALFLCRGGDDPLFEKQKPADDGALPSCNSIAAHQFLRLGMITGDSVWLDRADRILTWLSDPMQKWPGGHLHALHAYDSVRKKHPIVVLTGPKDSENMGRMRRHLYRAPGPSRWLAGCSTPHRPTMLKLAPWMETLPETPEATAWICYQTHCETSITDPDQLEKILCTL